MALFSNFYWLLPSKRLLDNYTYQFIKAIRYTFGTTKFKQMVSYSHVLELISQTNKCGNENTNLSLQSVSSPQEASSSQTPSLL